MFTIVVCFHVPCSVKYSGFLGLACVGLLTVCDLWQLLADKAIDVVRFALMILARSVTPVGRTLATCSAEGCVSAGDSPTHEYHHLLHTLCIVESGWSRELVCLPSFQKLSSGTVINVL